MFFFLKKRAPERRKPPASVVVLASGLRQDPLRHVVLHPVTLLDRSTELVGRDLPNAPPCRRRRHGRSSQAELEPGVVHVVVAFFFLWSDHSHDLPEPDRQVSLASSASWPEDNHPISSSPRLGSDSSRPSDLTFRTPLGEPH